jgi:hypothetical protein
VAFLIAAAVALVTTLVALTIHDADAAGTMVRRGGRQAAGSPPPAEVPPGPGRAQPPGQPG